MHLVQLLQLLLVGLLLEWLEEQLLVLVYSLQLTVLLVHLYVLD